MNKILMDTILLLWTRNQFHFSSRFLNLILIISRSLAWKKSKKIIQNLVRRINLKARKRKNWLIKNSFHSIRSHQIMEATKQVTKIVLKTKISMKWSQLLARNGTKHSRKHSRKSKWIKRKQVSSWKWSKAAGIAQRCFWTS
jgi:hypothetical protein